jgi:hypothetical protein
MAISYDAMGQAAGRWFGRRFRRWILARLWPGTGILGFLAGGRSGSLAEEVRRRMTAALIRVLMATRIFKEPMGPVLPMGDDGLTRLLTHFLTLTMLCSYALGRQHVGCRDQMKC